MPTSYSYSKIDSFSTCPQKYKFANIDRAKVEKQVSVEAYLGNAVHRVIEHIYKSKLSSKTIEIEEAQRIYRQFWDEGPDRENIKVSNENMSIDDYIEDGKKILDKFYDNYYPFDNGVSLAIEKNLSFPLDTGGKYSIRAKVDRLSQYDDGTIEIIDYKTKKTLATQQEFNRDIQMGLYLLGIKNAWPEFTKIRLKQIYLRHGVELSTEMNDDVMDEITYGVYQKILEIENAVRLNNFPTKESMLCNWCVYNELCPAKRHKLLLEEETDDSVDAVTGEKLAEKYLELDFKKKTIDSELKALKGDIVKYCESSGLSKLESDKGQLNVTIKEVEAFPTKTSSNADFTEISGLVRDAISRDQMDDGCLKLDVNALYKEYFIKERLPGDLTEKLKEFLTYKISPIVRSKHKAE